MLIKSFRCAIQIEFDATATILTITYSNRGVDYDLQSTEHLKYVCYSCDGRGSGTGWAAGELLPVRPAISNGDVIHIKASGVRISSISTHKHIYSYRETHTHTHVQIHEPTCVFVFHWDYCEIQAYSHMVLPYSATGGVSNSGQQVRVRQYVFHVVYSLICGKGHTNVR